MLKRLGKQLISVMLIFAIFITSYATGIDGIFGISAHAATATEKSKSMLDFYKNGAELDKSKISDTELYVFGVFVSNFLMPFQSVIGEMSSDSFVTQMAQMFFGDAYTAQQYADMKYTLGLVQSAQSSRAKLVSITSGNPLSLAALYNNMTGYISTFAPHENTISYYTYEGSGRTARVEDYYNGDGSFRGLEDLNDIVWISGSTVFDAIMGQLVSICPTQAGVYMGLAGKATSELYVDCFGNISDNAGVVIVPACMNPMSFFNSYLDGNRNVLTNPNTISNATTDCCPLQLPINNAFWMGTMIDPGSTSTLFRHTTQVQVPDGKGGTKTQDQVTTELRKAYISLPNLYQLVEMWSDSTTVLMGISTMDGEELGIYISSAIMQQYNDAWRAASGITTDIISDSKLEQYGMTGENMLEKESDLKNKLTVAQKVTVSSYISPWRYVGGTSVPISLVLDDIALFDTYNNFGDSLESTIHTMSMYQDDETGAWWANSTNAMGTKTEGAFAELYNMATEYARVNAANDETWQDFCLLAQAYTFYPEQARENDNRYKSGEGTVVDASEIYSVLNTAAMNNDFDTSTITDAKSYLRSIFGTDNEDDLAAILASSAPKTAAPEGSPYYVVRNIGDWGSNTGGDVLFDWIKGFMASPEVVDGFAWKDTVLTELEGGSITSDNMKRFCRRLSLAVATKDKTFCFGNIGIDSTFPGLLKNVEGVDVAVSPLWDMSDSAWNTNLDIMGNPMVSPNQPSATESVTSIYRYFLQKMFPWGAQQIVKRGWWASICCIVGAIITAIALIALEIAIMVACVASGGALAIVIASVALAVGLTAVIAGACMSQAGIEANAAYYKKISKTLRDASYGQAKLQYNASWNMLNGGVIESDATNNLGSGALGYVLSMRTDANKSGVDNPDNSMLSAGATYVSDYTLYGPYKQLAGSLAGVSKVYTENGIVDANGISSKVGSYITNDVNLWGGIYYAYMIDILALHIDENNEMTYAKLETNFPKIPEKLTASDKISFDSMLDSGDDIDSEAKEAEVRRDLMSQMKEMMDPKTSTYRTNLIERTINSWLVNINASICGADSSGSIANIGGGSQYTGYSSYITTATLSEMPFTSWVMEYYTVIYTVLMALIIILAVLMLLTGHRSVQKTIIGILSMSLILLVPRLTVDTAVSISNTLASQIYKDRFSFWAYAQHQQYMTKLDESQTEEEFLIVTNMQMAKDYYDNENGVTVKWMSPKKNSYWDSFSDVKGGSDDGLNLSIFTWLFQGYFRQEVYSTDPMATYLYRPYNDICMTAKSFVWTAPLYTGFTAGAVDVDSDVARSSYAAYTMRAWNDFYRTTAEDFDIQPSFTTPNYTSRNNCTGGTEQLRSSLPWYIGGLVNKQVTDVAYMNYVDKSDPDAYRKAYPCSSQDATTDDPSGLENARDVENKDNDGNTPEDADKNKDKTKTNSGKGMDGITDNLEMFYLYSESPYYYFYNVFKDAADNYTSEKHVEDGAIQKLLLSEQFFKYKGDNTAVEDTGKAKVDVDTLVDFMDMKGLFTYVIPYLRQSNLYVDEWTSLWGSEITTTSSGEFKKDLGGIWKMYSPWVDHMYEATYSIGDIRSVGKKVRINDCINPGYYLDTRPMVFSPAEMQRTYLTEADLSNVETRIQRVLEKTYTDFMYLNNYTTFDGEVLLSAMAMTATFNFNAEFSDTGLFGENIALYPTGYEVRNFNYDAFLRLALLNTTGNSIFSEDDIYTTVIESTNIFTGILLIINDVIAVYLVPAFKLVALLGLFFLGLILCFGSFLQPPEDTWKFLGKAYLLPFAAFFVSLLGHMLVISLFVGEGLTSLVGARGVTVTTGDPTVTILLLMGVNVLFLFLMYQVIRLLLKSFKLAFENIVAFAGGFVMGALAMTKGALKFGGKTVGGVTSLAGNVVGRPVKAAAHAFSKDIHETRSAYKHAKADAKYQQRYKDKQTKEEERDIAAKAKKAGMSVEAYRRKVEEEHASDRTGAKKPDTSAPAPILSTPTKPAEGNTEDTKAKQKEQKAAAKQAEKERKAAEKAELRELGGGSLKRGKRIRKAERQKAAYEARVEKMGTDFRAKAEKRTEKAMNDLVASDEKIQHLKDSFDTAKTAATQSVEVGSDNVTALKRDSVKLMAEMRESAARDDLAKSKKHFLDSKKDYSKAELDKLVDQTVKKRKSNGGLRSRTIAEERSVVTGATSDLRMSIEARKTQLGELQSIMKTLNQGTVSAKQHDDKEMLERMNAEKAKVKAQIDQIVQDMNYQVQVHEQLIADTKVSLSTAHGDESLRKHGDTTDTAGIMAQMTQEFADTGASLHALQEQVRSMNKQFDMKMETPDFKLTEPYRPAPMPPAPNPRSDAKQAFKNGQKSGGHGTNGGTRKKTAGKKRKK